MTYYVYDGLNLVQEVNAAGVVIASYVYDGLDHPLEHDARGRDVLLTCSTGWAAWSA